MVKNLKGLELQYFKDNFKVEGYFAPTVFTSDIDGQKYALCIGNPWIPIPDAMTTQEVHDKWVKKVSVSVKNKIEVKVPASRGKTVYNVTFGTAWNCTCSGFKFRKNCSHIDKVKEDLKSKFA